MVNLFRCLQRPCPQILHLPLTTYVSRDAAVMKTVIMLQIDLMEFICMMHDNLGTTDTMEEIKMAFR